MAVNVGFVFSVFDMLAFVRRVNFSTSQSRLL